MRIPLFGIVALLLIGAGASSTFAEDAGRPSAAELVQRLSPTSHAVMLRSLTERGVRVEDPLPSGPIVEPPPPSVDLTVNFEFNSAKLSTDAILILDNLGQALTDSRLANYRFLLAGHTDGVGGDRYNQLLSERRVVAVKNYLLARYRITPDRLEAVGRGKSELLDKDHPDAAVNRRVQVINLGS
jgi:outer membrane protein OmpA-like peptidoglycan-associated protein